MKLKADIPRIKECLSARGMSRRQLAHYAGVSVGTVDRILSGGTTVPYTAGRISMALLKRRESLFQEVKGGGENAGETGS